MAMKRPASATAGAKAGPPARRRPQEEEAPGPFKVAVHTKWTPVLIFRVEVKENDSIDTVKDKIFEVIKLEAFQRMDLYFGDTLMRDDMHVRNYFTLAPSEHILTLAHVIRIFLTTEQRPCLTLYVDVELRMFIKDIKVVIEQKVHAYMMMFELYWNGQLLDDDQRLEYYKIRHMEKITLKIDGFWYMLS